MAVFAGWEQIAAWRGRTQACQRDRLTNRRCRFGRELRSVAQSYATAGRVAIPTTARRLG